MSNKEKGFWGFLILVIIFIWWFSGYCISETFPGMSDRGQFGDMFGAINSLFSGLAFLGLIFTIRLQFKELQSQREELKLQHNEIQQNRQEMKRSADAQEKSEKAFLEQAIIMQDTAKMNRLNSLLSAYSLILDPTTGIKGRRDIKVEEIHKKIKAIVGVLEQYDELFKDYIQN